MIKILRYIATIPAIVLTLEGFYFFLRWLLSLFFMADCLWQYALLFSLGWISWGTLKFFSGYIMGMVSYISPNKAFSFVCVSLLSIGDGIYAIFRFWSDAPDYGIWNIICCVVFTKCVYDLTVPLLICAWGTFAERLD